MRFPRELVMHSRALELVKQLERAIEAEKMDIKELIIEPSNMLFEAAKSGKDEFLAELVRFYPELVRLLDKQGRSIFHIAILHRRFSVFKLIYEIGFDKDVLVKYVDEEKNMILHLAAMYPKPPPVSDLLGAALEMQREIQIFKEVEMVMIPSLRETKNSEGRTPQALFSIEHSKLLKRGERWMKEKANSCMIAATIVATAVFSVVFTLPTIRHDGDNTVLKARMETWFQVVALLDAVAFLASLFSIMIFLSILASGYKQKDFHRSLLVKLMLGLCLLSVSLLSMMVMFSSSIIIGGLSTLHIPMFTCMSVSLPVGVFVVFQFPILRQIVILLGFY